MEFWNLTTKQVCVSLFYFEYLYDLRIVKIKTVLKKRTVGIPKLINNPNFWTSLFMVDLSI